MKKMNEGLERIFLIKGISRKLKEIFETKPYYYVLDIVDYNIVEEFERYFAIKLYDSKTELEELRVAYARLDEFKEHIKWIVDKSTVIDFRKSNLVLKNIASRNKDITDLLKGVYGELAYKLIMRYKYKDFLNTIIYLNRVLVMEIDKTNSAFNTDKLNNTLGTNYNDALLNLILLGIVTDLASEFEWLDYSGWDYTKYLKTKYTSNNIQMLYVLIPQVSIQLIIKFLRLDDNYILTAKDNNKWPWGNQNISYQLYESIKDFKIDDNLIKKADLMGVDTYKDMSIRQAECLSLLVKVLKHGTFRLNYTLISRENGDSKWESKDKYNQYNFDLKDNRYNARLRLLVLCKVDYKKAKELMEDNDKFLNWLHNEADLHKNNDKPLMFLLKYGEYIK